MAPLETGQNPDEEPIGLMFKAKLNGKDIREVLVRQQANFG